MWNQKGLVVPTARYFTHLTGARDPDADDDEFSIAGFLRAMNSAIRRVSRFLAIGAQRGLRRSGRYGCSTADDYAADTQEDVMNGRQ